MGAKQGFMNRGARDLNVLKVLACTADKTLTNRHCEFLITNRGATATVAITMPAPATCKGKKIYFAQIAGYTLTFVSTGKLVLFNDATADSISFATSSELIGNRGFFLSDGTSWIPFVDTTPIGVAITGDSTVTIGT